MQVIEQYKITWRPEDDAGMVHLALANGAGASLPIDSAAEAAFLLDMLRNESPVFYDTENRLLATGMEPVGEGEA